NGHIGLQGNLLFALLLGAASIAVLQHVQYGTAASRRVLVFTLLALAVTDLTRYFWIASVRDQDFFVRNAGRPDPFPQEIRDRLRRPWDAPKADGTFEAAMVQNMPVNIDFWPGNRFMFP